MEEEEEESKDAKVKMMMQPQDYVTELVEAGKQAKIYQITEAYEQEVESTKKTLCFDYTTKGSYSLRNKNQR